MLGHTTMILWTPFLYLGNPLPYGQSPPHRVEAQHTSYSCPAGGAMLGHLGFASPMLPSPHSVWKLMMLSGRVPGEALPMWAVASLAAAVPVAIASRLGKLWWPWKSKNPLCSMILDGVPERTAPNLVVQSTRRAHVLPSCAFFLLNLDFRFSLFGLHLETQTDTILVGLLVCLQVYVYVHFFYLRWNHSIMLFWFLHCV